MMGALPKALARRGHRVMVVVPRYSNYEEGWETGVRTRIRVMGSDTEVGTICQYLARFEKSWRCKRSDLGLFSVVARQSALCVVDFLATAEVMPRSDLGHDQGSGLEAVTVIGRSHKKGIAHGHPSVFVIFDGQDCVGNTSVPTKKGP